MASVTQYPLASSNTAIKSAQVRDVVVTLTFDDAQISAITAAAAALSATPTTPYDGKVAATTGAIKFVPGISFGSSSNAIPSTSYNAGTASQASASGSGGAYNSVASAYGSSSQQVAATSGVVRIASAGDVLGSSSAAGASTLIRIVTVTAGASGLLSSGLATSANSASTDVAVLTSGMIKPVIGSSDPLANPPPPTGTTTPRNSDSDASKYSSFPPAAIAVTVLGCLSLLILLLAAIWLLRRRAEKHRRGVMAIGVEKSAGKYSEFSSVYSDSDDKEVLMADRSAPRHSQMYLNHHKSEPFLQNRNSEHFLQSRTSDPFIRSSYRHSTREPPEIRFEDYDDEYSLDEVDLHGPAPLNARSIKAAPVGPYESLSSAYMLPANSQPGGMETAASSPYLEPPLDDTALKRTFLGSFSASAPVAQGSPSPSEDVPYLMSPPRPNRPASLTSSIAHALDQHVAEHTPNMQALSRALSVTRTKSSAPTENGPVASAWGAKTMAQVFSASISSIKSALSPPSQSAAGPFSPSYDEEKADLFTDLPENLPRRKSSAVPARMWGSFATTTSDGMPDRRTAQQMPSRFSVTTLATGSPTPSNGSVYNDWQIRSAMRTNMAKPRRAPQLVAQRQSSSSGTDECQLEQVYGEDLLHAPDMQALASDSPSTGSSIPFAYTAPLNITPRPSIHHLANVAMAQENSMSSANDTPSVGHQLGVSGDMSQLILGRQIGSRGL